MSTRKFGPMIKAAREREGIERIALIEATGKSQSTLSRIEKGDLTPSWELADRLIAALGADDAEREKLERAWKADTRRPVPAKFPNFAEALSSALERAGIAPVAIATDLKVTQGVVHQWRTGDSTPGEKALRRITDMISKRGGSKTDVTHIYEMYTFDLLMNDERLSHLSLDERRDIARRSVAAKKS